MSVAQIPASKHAPDWPTNIFPICYWLIKQKKGVEIMQGQKWEMQVVAGKANQS